MKDGLGRGVRKPCTLFLPESPDLYGRMMERACGVRLSTDQLCDMGKPFPLCVPQLPMCKWDHGPC